MILHYARCFTAPSSLAADFWLLSLCLEGQLDKAHNGHADLHAHGMLYHLRLLIALLLDLTNMQSCLDRFSGHENVAAYQLKVYLVM